jgi:hypothetical protein
LLVKRDDIRLRITFADGTSAQEIEEFVQTDFGGFGGVSRGDSPRTMYLTGIYWPYDYNVVTAQLTALQRDGVLTWEEAT